MFAAALLITLAGCKAPPPSDMVEVSKGEFQMGSNDVDKEAKALQYGSTKPWYENERPMRTVRLDGFYIDKTEVTFARYKEFLDATGRKPPAQWPGGVYPEQYSDHPVVYVTWFDADEYCKWKGRHLPTEAEWEKAARGTDGRQFPWGNEFDIKKVNTAGEFSGTTPAGMFPEGKSPYGALDMAGNAQEWTADWYKPYPDNTFKDDDYGEKFKTVRGGGWGGMGHYTLQVYVRTSFRNAAPPNGVFNDVGFRCAQ
ncbi:MAG: SUMF1/EgtB/PvdO family nonheme iron enzyme [Deltaproteobacteria bacterium]|nr:SUMF1/EgtB/PvdO family nonheme iron enzyme [Deltaproteobacteria bacterium]